MSVAIVAGSASKDPVLAKVATTPEQTEGPFYPIDKPIDQDADLTLVSNSGIRADGDLLLVQGQILTPRRKPVANALVEIWQANAWGRYQDRRQLSNAPWDPNFQSYGHVTTGVDGQYSFRTIKPAGYGQGYHRRTPHIHFRISGHHFNRLTTQMYFSGEPENTNDGPLNRISDAEARKRLIVALQPFRLQGLEMQLGVFDIVLGQMGLSD